MGCSRLSESVRDCVAQVGSLQWLRGSCERLLSTSSYPSVGCVACVLRNSSILSYRPICNFTRSTHLHRTSSVPQQPCGTSAWCDRCSSSVVTSNELRFALHWDFRFRTCQECRSTVDFVAVAALKSRSVSLASLTLPVLSCR